MTEETDSSDEEYVITDEMISFPSVNTRSEPSTGKGLEPFVWPEGIKFTDEDYKLKLIVIMIILNALVLIFAVSLVFTVVRHYRREK
jgi:hypothetical protein